jgi:hypothetical protein
MGRLPRLAVFEPRETEGAAALLPTGAWPTAIRPGRGAAPPRSPVVLAGRNVLRVAWRS